jgi:Mn-dependent DtxR family transcriptional regulator
MEDETQKILVLINQNGTLDVMKISELLSKSVNDAKKIMDKLESEELVQRKIGNYYQLTFKGYKWVQGR